MGTDFMEISSNPIAPLPPSSGFRVILIFDMNSFFASVELRDYLRGHKVDLRGKPVIVGKLRRRKVVSTATPEARAFGVKKGMSTLDAQALCQKYRPDTVWLPVRTLVYEAESDEILKVVRDELAKMAFNPVIGTVGLDEAYVDLTPYCQGADADDSLDKARSVAEKLKARILRERGLHCKIGIASNKFLAKIATDKNAPDGINIIYGKDWDKILPPLDVNEIPGVGEVTEKKLKAQGFKTIADIRKTPFNFNFTPFVGKQIYLAGIIRDLAFGKDVRAVKPDGPPQSVSRCETFEYDTADMKIIGPIIVEFAEELSLRLKKIGMVARTVKIQYVYPIGDYEDWPDPTRQKTLKREFDDAGTIIALATKLMQENDMLGSASGKKQEIYSLSIAVERFTPAANQAMTLFNLP
jgi:DNA polymerase-4